MGFNSKQKVLSIILIIIIVIAGYFGWNFIMQKPTNTGNLSGLNLHSASKIVEIPKALFGESKEKAKEEEQKNYAELIQEYKDLKAKRMALDDQIAALEQEIIKVNKANLAAASSAPAASGTISSSSTTQPSLMPEATVNKGVVINYVPPKPAATTSLPATETKNEVNIKNLITDLQANKPTKTVVVPPASVDKVVIITPKKHPVEGNSTSTLPTVVVANVNASSKAKASENSTDKSTTTSSSAASSSAPAPAATIAPTTSAPVSKSTVTVTSTTSATTTPSSSGSVAPKVATTVQGNDYYVLQGMSGDKPKFITDYIKKHNLTSDVSCLKVKRDGKDWYILAYGNYSTKGDASLAVKSLPSDVKSLHPWVKLVKKDEATPCN